MACGLDIAGDLRAQLIQICELLFGPQVSSKSKLELLAVNLLCEIEEVHFQNAFAARGGHRGANPNVDYAAKRFGIATRIDYIDAIRRKLLVVRAQVSCRETDLLPEMVAFHDRSENGELTSKEARGGDKVALLNGAPNECAADDHTVHLHGVHAHLIKAELVPESLEQIQVARATFAKRPLMADTNFAQGMTCAGQFLDKSFRGHGGECFVEGDDQEMLNAQIANEVQFVPCGSEKPRRFAGTQHADRMRIEGDNYGSALDRLCISQRTFDYRAVAKMNSVEDSNRENNRTRDLG